MSDDAVAVGFISLGLPDALLGAAWPSMYPEFGVPVSFAGGISMIISVGTVASSLKGDSLTRRFGTGKVTAASVFLTAAALLGFSFSHSYWMLCLWAIPYGLGAGSVDASLNNYVALHYASRHMSWLHCMWGIGASVGPYIMGFALTGGRGWNMGYRYIALLQIALTAVLLFSLPLWGGRKRGAEASGADRKAEFPRTGAQEETSRSDGIQGEEACEKGHPLSLRQIIRIPGAKEVMAAFFCYCALEQTAGLWASSYLALHKGFFAEQAAGFAGWFFLGITAGRALSGFLTLRYNDAQMIRIGQGVLLTGLAVLMLPFGKAAALAGLALMGLGCAPIYPCIIHSTPEHFGRERSQAVIGVQMAFAYVGNCLMPPLFGLIANHISVSLFPEYLLMILSVMVVMHEGLLRITKKEVEQV